MSIVLYDNKVLQLQPSSKFVDACIIAIICQQVITDALDKFGLVDHAIHYELRYTRQASSKHRRFIPKLGKGSKSYTLLANDCPLIVSDAYDDDRLCVARFLVVRFLALRFSIICRIIFFPPPTCFFLLLFPRDCHNHTRMLLYNIKSVH